MVVIAAGSAQMGPNTLSGGKQAAREYDPRFEGVACNIHSLPTPLNLSARTPIHQ